MKSYAMLSLTGLADAGAAQDDDPDTIQVRHLVRLGVEGARRRGRGTAAGTRSTGRQGCAGSTI
jgi:hypothetical protein